MYENTVYQSTKRKQLAKSSVKFKSNPDVENRVLNIYPQMKYQSILGFGSAFTDASAINFSKMSERTKNEFLRLYFDRKDGLGLNFCRTHINSCDFSAQKYTYVAEGDKFLDSFDIAHDEQCIIPMINAAQRACEDDLLLICSPWSPPAYMKSNGNMLLGGRLKPEYYQAWADYFVKYIKAYNAHDIEFFALTVQNEPYATQTWESCRYTATETAMFVRDYLYPALKAANLDTKILIWDHNKEHAFDWANDMHKIPDAAELIDGVAFHWYSGDHFDALRMAHERNPEKLLIESEYCVGAKRSDMIASWDEAMKYAYDIIGNFNNYMNATIEWNMLLDDNGGPYHARLGPCKSMVHYFTDDDEIKIGKIYYAMAHFSKYVRRGAVRIGCSVYDRDVYMTAFENPDGSIVAVMQNYGKDKKCTLRLDNYAADIKLENDSITTIIIENRA